MTYGVGEWVGYAVHTLPKLSPYAHLYSYSVNITQSAFNPVGYGIMMVNHFHSESVGRPKPVNGQALDTLSTCHARDT